MCIGKGCRCGRFRCPVDISLQYFCSIRDWSKCTICDSGRNNWRVIHLLRLNLIFPDIPDVVASNVGRPVETFDHCYLSAVIKTKQAVPDI